MRDRFRPLVIFSPSDSDSRYGKQIRIAAAGKPELLDRQVLIVHVAAKHDPQGKGWGVVLSTITSRVLIPADAVAARQRFHIAPNDFTVLLLGKDGGEKLRSHAPVSTETLTQLIDTMPMRQEEMKAKPKSH